MKGNESTRRQFCGATGAGLLVLGAAGCDAVTGLLTGAVDDPYPVDASGADRAMPPPPDLARSIPDGGCASDALNLGRAPKLAVGEAARLTDDVTYDVFLCRDAKGLYTLNNVCPHAGCPVRLVSGPKFYCRCHGAEFDFDGSNPTAPALTPLDHLALCVDPTGNVLVDINTVVDPNNRV